MPWLQVHLIGGFEDTSPKVWIMILCFVMIFQTWSENDQAECVELCMCSTPAICLDQEAMESQTVIHCLFVLKLLRRCGRDKRSFISGLSLCSSKTLKGTLKEMHFHFSMASWLVKNSRSFIRSIQVNNTHYAKQCPLCWQFVFYFFKVEPSTGYVFPACFDRTSRCPDEIVRRIRVTACNGDPSWKGKLLDTYDTLTDKFTIAPCCW